MSEKRLAICVAVFNALYLAWSAYLIFAAAKRLPRREQKQRFDERQIAAQGAAYKTAFWTMLAYYLLYAIVCGAGELVWCDQFLGMFLGVIVGVTVFALICIFRDAYFSPDQSSASVVVMINVLCIIQGGFGLLHLSDGTVVEDGILTADATQLFLFLMGLIIDVGLFVKHRMEKREEQE